MAIRTTVSTLAIVPLMRSVSPIPGTRNSEPKPAPGRTKGGVQQGARALLAALPGLLGK